MDQSQATRVFESLASAVRLKVFRLLVRQGPAGLVAGEIAISLDLPPTNLSFHLKNLTHAGLVTVAQEGRYQRYRANMPLMLSLIAYLTEECCSGDPSQCAGLRADSTVADERLPPLNAPANARATRARS